MDGLMLLRRARDAGLGVRVEGDRLLIRGPKRAEPVARLLIEYKPEVIAALGIDPAWWRREFIVRTLDRLIGNRARDQAERFAFNHLVLEWHWRRGRRWPAWECAGCGLVALDLADGNRVHFADRLDCVLSFGERWRSEATAGLRALGLDPPLGFDAGT